MNHSRLTPEKALTVRAGIELDVFIFEYVFDQEIDTEEWKISANATSRQIPSFSKRAEASKILMIRMFADEPFQMIIERGNRWFNDAVEKGFILPGNEIPLWTVMGQGLTSHGRTYEEAIAKLAIQFKMKGVIA